MPRRSTRTTQKVQARVEAARALATSPPEEPEPVQPALVVPPEQVEAIIQRYTWAAAVAMFAVPIPGADMAATFAVWGAMIRRIAHAYGYAISRQDGMRLASELFRNAVLTTFAWFGSTKVATTVLKFIPFAGTVTAYSVDAAVAAAAAKKITATVGNAAALYYGTGKVAAPRTLDEHVTHLAKDPVLWNSALNLLRANRAKR